MSVSESQRAAANKWDAANMAYQTCKVPKTLLAEFKAACAARGDKVNTVLRQSMERYVRETPNEVTIAAMMEADAITADENVPGCNYQTNTMTIHYRAIGEDTANVI